MNLPVSVEELSKEHILDLCHSFVAYDDFFDTFLFVHLSVREYLETRPEFASIQCHKLAAESCLIQLIGCADSTTTREFLREEYAFDVSSKAVSISRQTGLNLCHYSSIFCMEHCAFVGEKDRQNHDRFQKIFRFFLSQDIATDYLNTSFKIKMMFEERPKIRPFLIACEFSFCEIIRENLESSEISNKDWRETWKTVCHVCHGDKDDVLKMLLMSRGHHNVPSNFVEDLAKVVKAETFLWVLQHIPDVNLTADLVYSASRTTHNVLVLFDHFDASEWSAKTLVAAAGSLSEKSFRTLLIKCDDIEVNDAMLITAVGGKNYGVVEFLVKKCGLKFTGTMLEDCVADWTSDMIRNILQHGHHTISTLSMQNAALNADSNVLQLLHGLGGTISKSVLAIVAGFGNAQRLQTLLDYGHAVSKTLLLMGVCNQNHAGPVIDLLLTKADHGMISEQSQAMLKRAAATSHFGGGLDLRQLKRKLRCETVSEDIWVAAILNKFSHSNFEYLLTDCFDSFSRSTEVMEVMMEEVTSKRLMQLLLNGLGHFMVTEHILKAVAANRAHGDDLMMPLLKRCPDFHIPACVWDKAISNKMYGLEILSSLEGHVGRIDITEDLLMKAALRGSAPVMRHLLKCSGETQITERVVAASLANESRWPDEGKRTTMVQLLLEQVVDFPISDQLLEKAACNGGFEAFQFLWTLISEPRVHISLVQAASKNCHDSGLLILRFLLERAEDIELDEKTIEVMLKIIDCEETLEDYADRKIRLKLTHRVLVKAVSDSSISEPQIRLLLKHAEADADTHAEDFLQTAAASGLLERLVTLSDHYGMDEVPSKWTDIANLHWATAWEAWYFRDHSYSRPEDEYCDPDMDLPLVKYLLARNIPCDLPDGDGKTPLALAAEAGNELIVKALLDAGADPDGRDFSNRSPIFHAASSGHYEIVMLLLGKGVEIDLVDVKGVTMAESAKRRAHMKIYRLLQGYKKEKL